ncbi:hypothetical protein HPB47_022209 [Ixodes persulcatus]|uniref:Uncharacterized protein n=1 Tax=Ixodes persulcatus TaxID=34615 RepID=A0AC60QCU2_IXOPE|nr:hypothetical protein HPB47_022209 [Ixodes persulcatus]
MWRFASLVLCSVAVTSGAFAPDYAAYHNLSSAYRRVGALADAFPGFVRVDHSFKSRNGLSQLLVRLSNFSDSSHAAGPHVQSFKVKALLSYGESARELLPVESILHFLRRVLRGLGAPKDSTEEAFSRALFSKVDLYVVVLLNPDGRNHVERTGDHCWKGTGTGANLGAAFGLDVDRSLREPECNILLNLTKSQTFDAFISFHSGRREIHLPLTGFQSKKAGSSPANMEAMAELAGAMAESVQPHLARDERTNRVAGFSVEGTPFNFMAAVRKIPFSLAVHLWGDGHDLGPDCFAHFNPSSDSLQETLEGLHPLYQKMFLLLIAWKAKQMSLAFNVEHDSPSSTMYLLMLAAAVVVTLLFVCQHRFPNPMRLNPRRRVISLKSLSSSLHVS